MAKLNKKTIKRLQIGILFLLILIFGIFIWWQNGIAAVNTQDKSTQSFVVDKGAGLRTIASNLKSDGLIRDPIVFFLEVKKLNLDGTIQAGDFHLSPSMTADEIIKTMTHGTEDIWVTIPEGKRSEEITAILKATMPTYSPDWGTTLKAHEGYLFPDTYLFPHDADINTIISIMTANFDKKYALAKAQQTNSMDEQDAVILASILEREGRSGQDMKNIASVLENRLNIGMALQVDATIQYALGFQPIENSWWKKSLTADDIQINSPYNTYQNPGLPPTPISNPGLESLEAVLNPAKTNYLYYISDKNGTLHFAETLEQHNANIRKYGL
jgi:UPF0755 protein